MKTRAISLLLAVAMIASMIVLPVGAEGVSAPEATALTETCPCGCGEALSEVEWQPWQANDVDSIATGHYYLEADYAQAVQETIISGKKVVLDLKGHTLTTEKTADDDYHRLFLVEGQVSVIDTVGGGVISAKTGGNGHGGVVMVRNNETTDAAFNMYDCTMMPDADNKGGLLGGLICASNNATVRVNGGMLLNGTSTRSGGAIYAYEGAQVEITDSMILNCSCTGDGGAIRGEENTDVSITGTSIIGSSAGSKGGSIYSTGDVTVRDSKIWNGTAQDFGGNLYIRIGTLTVDNSDIAFGTCYGTAGIASTDTTSDNYGGGNIAATHNATLVVEDSTIRDGYSHYSGGNVYYTAGTQTFTNTTIKGGFSTVYGGNLATFSTSVDTTFDGCTIDGDVFFGGATLTVKGATKIGLHNNGLDLYYNSATKVINAAELSDGAEIFVEANGVFTDAGANADYFKPALRTGEITVDETTGGLTASQVESGVEGGYCPHCYDAANPQKVTWTAFDGTVGTGHYYLTAKITAKYNVNNVDFVLDTNGKSWTVTGNRVVQSYNNAEITSMTVLDSVGGSKISATGYWKDGASPYTGGVIYTNGKFTLDIYGGQFIYTADSTRPINNGGIIYAEKDSVKINIHGGLLDASQYNYTDKTGGAVCIADSGTSEKVFNMTAGRILGGSAGYGGSLYLGQYVDADITGGVISGGTSVQGGGNIRVYVSSANAAKAGTLDMKDCAVIGGEVTGNYGGGNIYTERWSSTIDNCYIADGICSATGSNTAGYGGNIYAKGTGQMDITDTFVFNGTVSNSYGGNMNIADNVVLNMSDSVLLNGYAAKSGGNFYSMSNSIQVNLTECLMLCGKAAANGGNAMFNNGKNTVKGGAFLFGVAGVTGGNIYANAGNTTSAVTGQKTALTADAANSIPAPMVCNGKARDFGGNIYTRGVTELNDALISSGSAADGKDIYLDVGANADPVLTLNFGVTGKISMGAKEDLLTQPVYGEVIAHTVSSGVAADITLEGDYGKLAKVVAKDGALYVGGASVVDAAGAETWYVTNADAVAASDDDTFVRLYTDNALEMTKACTVDFNGHTVNVSGEGELSGMDNSGDSFEEPTGGAVGGNVAAMVKAPNGNTYFAISDGENTTFHRLDMAIYQVAAVPNRAGLFYRAKWDCDSTLAGEVDTYGVAVSVNNMPTANFRNETDGADSQNDNLWTALAGDTLKVGGYSNSLLIENIMTEANGATVNESNGEMPIYATAYITVNGVTYTSDDSATAEDDVNYSLRTFMEALDALIDEDPTTYRQAKITMKDFYSKWADNGMGDWTFKKLAPPADPAADEEYNLLMIGSSFAYYYVQELYALLTEAGYQNVRVCNVYYSGCNLSQHYNWWINNEAQYQFYVTDETGRHRVGGDVSLEYCLAQYNWDAISIMDANSDVWDIGAQAYYEQTEVYHSTLIPYLKSEFPEAEHLWHQTWAYQMDYARADHTVESAQQQEQDALVMKEFAQLICEEYGLTRVNSGEAWQAYRDVANADDTDTLEDTLCARYDYGTNDSGDGYHDGDIGGGQLLNACVWFEVLTGEDCTQSSYVPTYENKDGSKSQTLSDELVTAIRAAAHEAVAAMKAEEA